MQSKLASSFLIISGMKKFIILFAMLLILSLSGCREDRHYFVTIINNSDYTIVVTGNRAGSTLVGSRDPRVTFSYVFESGTPNIEPHSELILDMTPIYFEKFPGDPTDRLRFYIIGKDVFDAAGGKPRNLNPGDYLGYIDLSGDEAKAVNWTVRFPDDTTNNL